MKLKTLFLEIWHDRKCTDGDGAEYVRCVECHKKIYEQNLKVHHFSHDHSKGARPDLKFSKDNISIRCFFCHSLKDNGLRVKYNMID